jgi:integrase
MASPRRLRGQGWFAWYSGDAEQWILKYRVRANAWLMHRVPKRVQQDADAERYAKTFTRAKLERRKTAETRATGVVSPDMTFRQLGEMWTSGKLHALYPSYIGQKKSSKSDESRLRLYVYDKIGNLAVRDLASPDGVTRCKRVVAPVEAQTSRTTARHVALVIHRLLGLAAFPLEIIPNNPLPKGFLPKLEPDKAKSYIYPDEDLRLMRCVRVPLVERLFYGFLVREGPRVGEVRELQLCELDFEHGWGHVDETKTGKPKDWPLHPGTLEALKRFRDRYMPSKKAAAFVFAGKDGELLDPYLLARKLREYLKLAKVNRPQLFMHSQHRLQLRAHDLRASFVTVALANNKTESWVADRTGHMSSQMINKYKRWARGHREQNLGDWTPLYRAIPELNDNPEQAIEAAAKDWRETLDDEDQGDAAEAVCSDGAHDVEEPAAQ